MKDDTRDIDEIAQDAQMGIDTSEHFTGRFQAKQNVSIAFLLELLERIDLECKRQNIKRQDWIQTVCSENFRKDSV